MNSALVRLFEILPQVEILTRCTLSRFPHLKSKLENGAIFNKYSNNTPSNNWDDVKRYIDSLPIFEGDLLLVHSSMDGLFDTGASAKDIIDYLLQKLGKAGTLVFAAYPHCKQDKSNADTLIYDPKRTLSWTGMLPNVFLRYEGVTRSPYPYNSLAALGPLAEEMMKDNLLDDKSQDKHSAWAYLLKHNVKTLFLGVSAAMSCTWFNYPEDALGDEWYVDNWYHTKKYIIKLNGESIEKTIYERNPEWYRFYAMFYSEKWLLQKNLLIRKTVGKTYIGLIEDTEGLVNTLLENAHNKKSAYRIPKKYWKKP